MNTKIIRPFDNLVHVKFALVTDPPMTEALITTMHDLILHPPIELGISRMPRLESCGLAMANWLLLYGVPPDERLIKDIQGLIDLAERRLGQIDTATKQIEEHKKAQIKAQVDNASDVEKRALGQI